MKHLSEHQTISYINGQMFIQAFYYKNVKTFLLEAAADEAVTLCRRAVRDAVETIFDAYKNSKSPVSLNQLINDIQYNIYPALSNNINGQLKQIGANMPGDIPDEIKTALANLTEIEEWKSELYSGTVILNNVLCIAGPYLCGTILERFIPPIIGTFINSKKCSQAIFNCVFDSNSRQVKDGDREISLHILKNDIIRIITEQVTASLYESLDERLNDHIDSVVLAA